MRVGSWVAALFCAALAGGAAHAEPLQILIDADYSITPDPAEAIELGVRTALEEVDYEIGGVKVEIARRDHHGNMKRARRTYAAYVTEGAALAIIGGMQSPPYLTYREFINENGVLILLPWSAAGPVTRAPAGETNWIFRLSVDDSKAGPFLVSQAIDRGCGRLSLVLMDTGWGRANAKSMSRALEERGFGAYEIVMFPSQIAAAGARDVARQVAEAGADCAIMLSSATAAAEIAPALAALDDAPRVFSHWGVLSAEFIDTVGHETREALSLRVLQTCGLEVERAGSQPLSAALEAAGLESLSDLKAPVGFVHGYDLGKILVAAGAQAEKSDEWARSVEDKRAALRKALQNLETKVPGILATYDRPFSPYAPDAPDAHEALGADDLCMAVFDASGRLLAVE